jgi:hypothetical protein
VPVAKLAGAVGLVLLGLLLDDGDRTRLALAGLVAAGLGGWAVPDLVAPVRLAVTGEGLLVRRGYLGRTLLPWATVETIDLDRRSRRGVSSELLEIDAGDSLHLFGRYDLDAPLDEVAAALRAARPAGPTPRAFPPGPGEEPPA